MNELDVVQKKKMTIPHTKIWLPVLVGLLGYASAETRKGLYNTDLEEPGYQLNIGHLPILVTITDQQGHPVSGAHAALKRIQEGGYTKEDITGPGSVMSDSHGQLLINYPTVPNPDRLPAGEILLRGAITVVAEGYNVVAVELTKEFPKPVSFLSTTSVPWLKVTLIRTEAQGGTEQPASSPESKSEGGYKPQLKAEGHSRYRVSGLVVLQ